MALAALRLRRALRPLSAAAALVRQHPLPHAALPVCDSSPRWQRIVQFAPFRSSSALRDRRSDSSEGKIDPNEILFEGCDYNHWLITMDFPKDQNLTPEEMVETYVQTCAKVVGSREEAMKRIYACSTTTYQGFQVEVSEEMSEKFRGLPGVVFILPDSYIDPVNKEYGGDKYEMGKITPRPPPIQYGRQGRYGDRNRNYDRPRYDRPRDSVPGQGNQFYNPQGPAHGDGRNYGSPTHFNVPQQQVNRSYDHQPPVQANKGNYVPQQNYNSMGQHGMQYGQSVPSQGDGVNYASWKTNNPHDHQNPMQQEIRNYSQQEYYPGGPQGGMPYSQHGVAPGQGMNHSPQQMYNPNGQPGGSPHGQQGYMNGEPRYYAPQQNYGPPSEPGNGTPPSVQRRSYSQHIDKSPGNGYSHHFLPTIKGNNEE